MGTIAGFWAGVAVAILGLVSLFVIFLGEYQSREIGLSSIVNSTFITIPDALLALLFGSAIGTLGGFVGKTYAENSVPQPAASAQPAASIQASPSTAQSAQPSPSVTQPATQPPSPQQNQP